LETVATDANVIVVASSSAVQRLPLAWNRPAIKRVRIPNLTEGGSMDWALSKGLLRLAGASMLFALLGMNAAAQPTCQLTCPPTQVRSTDPNLCTAVVTYPAPTIIGTCGTVTAAPASGSVYPKGMTTVTVNATQGPSCTFTITVNDTQPPTITPPQNIIRQLGLGETSVAVNYPPFAAADNCPGVVANAVPPSGSVFPIGQTTVTGTATDTSGNSASATFLILVLRYIEVPTLSEWGLVLLALLLGAGLWWQWRRMRV
jgi:hypothetical protein